MKRIADNIAQIRKDKGISQRELAKQADVSISIIKTIETSKANPTVKTLARIARALETDIKEIV